MFKTRSILVFGVLALLLVAPAVTYARPAAPQAADQGASDFYQRHPEWASNAQDALIPRTGISEFPDYHQRHPELRVSAGMAVDTTDYFARHPELLVPVETTGLSDYFLRH